MTLSSAVSARYRALALAGLSWPALGGCGGDGLSTTPTVLPAYSEEDRGARDEASDEGNAGQNSSSATGSPTGSVSEGPSTPALNGTSAPAPGSVSGTAAPAMGAGGAAGGAAVEGTGGAALGVGGSSMALGTGGTAPEMPGAAGAPAIMPPPPPPSTACVPAPPAFFCEDFEGLPVGTVQGNINRLRPEKTVAIAQDPERGQVLQFQSAPTYAAKNGVFLDNFSAPNNSYFGRMYARVNQFPNAGGDHWVMVEARLLGNQEQVRPVGGQFSRWAPGADGPSAGDWTDWDQSNVQTVAGAWECVEWQMNGANGGNDISLWVDGVQVQPRDRGNFSFPVVNELWLGWVVYQAGQPAQYDVRLDDIVLSTQRIGCD